MKIQLQTNNYYQTKQRQVQQQRYQQQPVQQPAFKGLSGFLNFLATNLAWGANLTDVTFMVLPRTGREFSRGIDAVAEAGFRESMGTANDSSIGLYGAGAGAILGGALASTYDVKAKQIYTSPARLTELAKYWEEHLKTGSSEREYLTKVVDNIVGYNTSRGTTTGYVEILKEDKKAVVDILEKIIKDDTIDIKTWRKKCTEKGVVSAIITESTGAEARFKLGESGTSAVNTLLDDIVGITKAFKKEKVNAEFLRCMQESGTANKFLKSMSKFNTGRALIGFLVGSGIGMGVQPFNVWMTKKRTGKEGFVGNTDGSTKDKSTKFLLERLAVGSGMLAMVLATLKCKPLPKEFISKMAFEGLSPTLNQLKGIYGMTIIGRVFATRGEDELRESAVKDTCGFLSWLVLGDVVNRGTAALLTGKELLNYNKAVDGNAITGSALKSRSEVLREALRGAGIQTRGVDMITGKERAMTVSEMIKVLETHPAARNIKKAVKGKLRVLNFAQLMGYAFTGAALGFGIPTLNIHMTRKSEAKRKAREEAAKLEAQKVASEPAKQDVQKAVA